MPDYSDDTPYECSWYVYNKAGERVAWLEARAHSDAQSLGRKGHRDMKIAEPYRDLAVSAFDPSNPTDMQMTMQFMWVNLMLWRHRQHADQWAVQLDKDEDLKTYLEWFPQLAFSIEAVSDPTETGRSE